MNPNVIGNINQMRYRFGAQLNPSRPLRRPDKRRSSWHWLLKPDEDGLFHKR